MLLLYALSVVAVVLAVDVAIGIAWSWGMAQGARAAPVPRSIYALGALGTLSVIAAASAYHMFQLREGGEAIASMLGATRVPSDTRDPLERRLLNVVEEMSIASGVRVPAVFVLQDEPGINAFAAGYDHSKCIVAVTRGTLQTLNRDELQGVVGHEFSHILNGDMGLNLRMMSVLGGLLFIGAVGSFLMRSAGRGRRSVGSKSSGSGGIFLFGLALFVIGYVGVFFGRLIKAAVSRQREFLADAASVQFTRNPAGIAGALDQIRSAAAGAHVMNRYAEDLSHMFFGQAVNVWMHGLFDTHPPLDERIRRVLPGFGAEEYRRRRPAAETPAEPEPAAAPAAAAGKRTGDQAYAWGRTVAQSVALVGALQPGKVEQAKRLLERFPPALREASRDPAAAGPAILALMLAQPQEVMERQLQAAAAAGAGELAQSARPLVAQAQQLPSSLCLPLIDLALPALKSASAGAQKQLLDALAAVIRADRRVSLHEFVVFTLVRAQLRPTALPAVRKSVSQLQGDVVRLLSLVAQAGRGAGGDPEAAFRAGERQLGLSGCALEPSASLGFQAVSQALENLRALAPLAQSELMGALFAVVSADGKVNVAEAELMRLTGAVLGCPLPPLFEEAELEA